MGMPGLRISKQVLSLFIAGVFLFETIFASYAAAQEVFVPAPGVFVSVSQPYNPPVLNGIIINPNEPFAFDFILNLGDENLKQLDVSKESEQLIKYFLAALTVPEEELWVNLSPYEDDRIITETLEVTEFGRNMLLQDYLLKQLSASLTYPESELGQKFWNKVRQRAEQQHGLADIPLNTYNKIWIVPETAKIYEDRNKAFITYSHLKVMTEEDYFAYFHAHEDYSTRHDPSKLDASKIAQISTDVMKDVILPIIEEEVNRGKHFAALRQIYHSFILAVWYKDKLKSSILTAKYADQNKVQGLESGAPNSKEEVYQKYLQAYRKGVYDYIKEEYDPASQQIMPRKYFSGGIGLSHSTYDSAVLEPVQLSRNILSNQFMRVSGRYQMKKDERSDDAVVMPPLPAHREKMARKYVTLRNANGQSLHKPRFKHPQMEEDFNRVISQVSPGEAREVFIFSDGHSLYRPTRGVLNHVRRNILEEDQKMAKQEGSLPTEVIMDGDNITIPDNYPLDKITEDPVERARFEEKRAETIFRSFRTLQKLHVMANDEETRDLLKVHYNHGNKELDFMSAVFNKEFKQPEKTENEEEYRNKINLLEIARFILDTHEFSTESVYGDLAKHVNEPDDRIAIENVLRIQRELAEELGKYNSLNEIPDSFVSKFNEWYKMALPLVQLREDEEGYSLEDIEVKFYKKQFSLKERHNLALWHMRNKLLGKPLHGKSAFNPNDMPWIVPYEIDAILAEEGVAGKHVGHKHGRYPFHIDYRIFNGATDTIKRKGYRVVSPADGVYFQKYTDKAKNKKYVELTADEHVQETERNLAIDILRDRLKRANVYESDIYELTQEQLQQRNKLNEALSEEQLVALNGTSKVRGLLRQLKKARKRYNDAIDGAWSSLEKSSKRLLKVKKLQAQIEKIYIDAYIGEDVRATPISDIFEQKTLYELLRALELKNVPNIVIEGKIITIRLDLNGVAKNGKIDADARFMAALPTIKQALEAGAKAFVISHNGRPLDEINKEMRDYLPMLQKRRKVLNKRKTALENENINPQKAENHRTKISKEMKEKGIESAHYEYVLGEIERNERLIKEFESEGFEEKRRVYDEIKKKYFEKYTNRPIAPFAQKVLSELMGKEVKVHFFEGVHAPYQIADFMHNEMQNGELVMGEDIRFIEEEQILEKSLEEFEKNILEARAALPSDMLNLDRIKIFTNIYENILQSNSNFEHQIRSTQSFVLGAFNDIYRWNENIPRHVRHLAPSTFEKYIEYFDSNDLTQQYRALVHFFTVYYKGLDKLEDAYDKHMEFRRKLLQHSVLHVIDAMGTAHRRDASMGLDEDTPAVMGYVMAKEMKEAEEHMNVLEFAWLNGKSDKSIKEKLFLMYQNLRSLPTMKYLPLGGQPAIILYKALDAVEGSAPFVRNIDFRVKNEGDRDKFLQHAIDAFIKNPDVRSKLNFPKSLVFKDKKIAPNDLVETSFRIARPSEQVENNWKFHMVSPEAIWEHIENIKDLNFGLLNGPSGVNKRDQKKEYIGLKGDSFLPAMYVNVPQAGIDFFNRVLFEEFIAKNGEVVPPFPRDRINEEIATGRFDTLLIDKVLLFMDSQKGKKIAIIGGGTVGSARKNGLDRFFQMVQTAGGAMIQYMSKQPLPAYEELIKRRYYPATYADYLHDYEITHKGGILEKATLAIYLQQDMLEIFRQMRILWGEFDDIVGTDFALSKMANLDWVINNINRGRFNRHLRNGKKHFGKGDEEVAAKALRRFIKAVITPKMIEGLPEDVTNSEGFPSFKKSFEAASTDSVRDSFDLSDDPRTLKKVSDILAKIDWLSGFIGERYDRMRALTIDERTRHGLILSHVNLADILRSTKNKIVHTNRDFDSMESLLGSDAVEEIEVNIQDEEKLTILTHPKRFRASLIQATRNGKFAVAAQKLKKINDGFEETGEYVSFNAVYPDRVKKHGGSHVRGKVRLSASFDEKTSEVVVKIKDNGIGMDTDDIENVLHYSYNKETDFQDEDGNWYRVSFGQATGMGLAALDLDVSKNGGKLSIQSDKNTGTEIEIRLPQVTEKDLQDSPYPEIAVRSPTKAHNDEATISDLKQGGIDFNPDFLELESQGVGVDLDFAIDPAQLQSIEIPGLIPQVLQITPINNLPQLLGLNDGQKNRMHVRHEESLEQALML